MNEIILLVQIGEQVFPVAKAAYENISEAVARIRAALANQGVEFDDEALAVVIAEAEAREAARRAQGTQPDNG